jgi:hypothetical protein
MKRAILVIGEREKTAIAHAIAEACKRPVSLEFIRRSGVEDKPVLKLADRKPGYRDRWPPAQVLIPVGYRAAVSFEEQPPGICIHLSISVERDDPKWMPNAQAVAMIAEAFGIKMEDAERQGAVWIEEYEPGRHAVNIVKLVSPRQQGHA